MASFLNKKTASASLENFHGGLTYSLEEEMSMTADANDEVEAATVEVEQAEAAENVVAAADQTADLIEENNGELDQAGVVAVDNLMTAANNIAQDDGINNPGDPLNEADVDKLIPVTESAGKYFVSIEGFRETFSKIKKKILEICDSIWKRIKAAYRNYFGVYGSLIKRAGDIEKRAEDLAGKKVSAENKTFDITSGAQYLCVGDVQPTTNNTGILSALTAVKNVTDKKILTAMKDLGKSLVDGVKGSSFSDVHEMNKGTGLMVQAITKYLVNSQSNFSTSSFVGQTMIVVESGPAEKATDPTYEKLNVMLQHRVRIEDGELKLKDTYKFTTLTSSEVKKIASTVQEQAKSLKTYETGMDELEKYQKELAKETNALESRANKAEADDDKSIPGLVAAYNAITRGNTYYANAVSTLAKMLKLATGTMQNALYLCNKSLDLHK